jgi:hypothetical protein
VLNLEELAALGELTVRYAQLDEAIALVGRYLLGCVDEERRGNRSGTYERSRYFT